MLRDKTAAYLEYITRELIQLVTEDNKCKSVWKERIHFDQLKYQDRDEMEEIFAAYYKKHPFDLE